MNPVTASTKEEQTYTGIPTSKVLLWICIVSIIMLFAGLTSAYIVRQAEGNWVEFSLPRIFIFSTLIIFFSSITLHIALISVKKNNFRNLLTFLIITLGLGLAFCFTQFLGWSRLVEQEIYFVGNPSGSFLYVITALHLAHLLGGIIYLLVLITDAIRMKYNSGNYLPVQLGSIYWHFLDILWIYLFVFLLIIR